MIVVYYGHMPMITKSVHEDQNHIAIKSMNQLSASINQRNQRV